MIIASCKSTKFADLPFHKSITYSLTSLDVLHFDRCEGPTHKPTKGGSGYYIRLLTISLVIREFIL